jgi:methyl-accepting chemotaxis protein
VAEEVRNLAARSASAAKETTEMIERSIIKADAGVKIADSMSIALKSIVEGVAQAAKLATEIAGASNEQANAIAQVNQGLEQMAQVVQMNSATSEEAAAASEELSGQAELLKSMVAQFGHEGEARVQVPSRAGRDKPVISLGASDFGKY